MSMTQLDSNDGNSRGKRVQTVGSDAEQTWTMPEILPPEGIPVEHLMHLEAASEKLKFASKQEQDFVFASYLLRGRHLSERVLRRELKSWTPFGDVSLREFLSRQKLLPEEVLAKVEKEGENYLRSLQISTSWQDATTVAQRTSSLLERIDPTGRVAKVFGLSNIPRAVLGNETRTFRTQYRLIRKLGQGGLGTVWLAVDQSLNRYVAVKEITGNSDQHPVAVARFRREAEITGRLDHPSIVPIHILAENESDGRIFYVMRFLGNQTLEDAIREYHERRSLGQHDPLTFHRLMTAFVSICQAIAYAHSHKVVHRDLKPQNVALDSFGQVIVLDWGLARVLGLEEPQSLQLQSGNARPLDRLDVTLAGQVIGTPMYMAPEQAAGRVDEIDERTDIYGLGAILFAILTGYAPHELGHESLAAGDRVSALLDLIVDQPTCSPRQLDSEIPLALEAICLKAMSKDRYLRYATASDLSDDLQRWMADEPISALQDTFFKQAQRWTRRHSTLSKGLLLLAVALIVGCLYWAFNSYHAASMKLQNRLQALTDDTRKLRARVSHELESLGKTARFAATLPSIQGMIEARSEQNDELDDTWKNHLKRTYRGLLEVNPNYNAFTCWMDSPDAGTVEVRVGHEEELEAWKRLRLWEMLPPEKLDPKMARSGHIYLGIPGHVDSEQPLLTSKQAALRVSDATVSHPLFQTQDLVAGAPFFDEKTGKRMGGISLECNFEKLLRYCTSTTSIPGVRVDITDMSGNCFMTFSSEKGLLSADRPLSSYKESDVLARYFSVSGVSEICVASPSVSAAKIPLGSPNEKHFLGIILYFPR